MTISSSYPVLLTHDVAGAAAFYRTHFDYESTFESDWYVSLRHGAHELAVLDADHETIPATHRGRIATGMLLNLEVDDVDAWNERFIAAALPIAQPIRSEGFGQRHVIVEAPDGVLVDVIAPIEPSAEFAAQFAD